MSHPALAMVGLYTRGLRFLPTVGTALCSANCAKAYVLEHSTFDRGYQMNMFVRMLRDVYGIDSTVNGAHHHACLSICLAVHSILTLFVSRPNVRASRYQHVDALRRSVKPPLRGRSCPSSHAHAPPSKRTHQLTTERAVRCARHSAGCSSSRHQAEHVCTFMPRPAQRPHSTL